MRLLFIMFKPPPYLQHIHVVIMPFAGISGEVHVLFDYAFHRAPFGSDVRTYSPRRRYIFSPCAGESPSANVYRHITAASLVYGGAYLSITAALVKIKFIARTAVVYLYIVEFPLPEIQIDILDFMAVQSRPDAVRIIIIH